MHNPNKMTTMALVPCRPEFIAEVTTTVAAAAAALGGPVGNPAPGESRKQRLPWTSALHDPFVDAIALLGGPDRATPKGVLRVMGVPGLTIYHVNSHLQKYRLAKYLPESGADGDLMKIKTILETASTAWNLLHGGLQINEALRMQMEVQKRLHEQLEVQRQLQMRIEAQGKYLQKIIEEQQKLGGSLLASESRTVVEDKQLQSCTHQAPDASAGSTSPRKKQKLIDGGADGFAAPAIGLENNKHSFGSQWEYD